MSFAFPRWRNASRPALPTPRRRGRLVPELQVLEARTLLSVTIQFDYSDDASHFFDTQAKKDVLQLAATTIAGHLNDTLAAIQPSGTNTWTANFTNPSTGGSQTLTNPAILANTLVVYVGARSLGSSEAGIGGGGGFGASGTQAWLDLVSARGQSGALSASPTDYGPWGGSIAFSSTTNWYFGTDPAGLASDQVDFYSVAEHELGHVLGIGTSPSWQTYVSGGNFTGPASEAAHGGTAVPLDPTHGHWANGTTSGGNVAVMTPVLLDGTRRQFTPLDYAGLQDVGWSLQPAPLAIVDHGQAGYSQSGTWSLPPASYNATGYNGNGWLFAAGTTAASPTATATWQAGGLAPGPLNVQVSWFANPNRATNAPYRIYDGNTLLATVRVNQQASPTGATVGGVPFQSLGIFQVSSGTLKVVLGNDANGYVIADALRVDASATPPPPPSTTIDHGQAGYTQSGTWALPPASYNATGYNGNGWLFAAGTTAASPTATATWQAGALASGNYEVDASWFAAANRADNAPYRIYDGNTLLATVRVNQQAAPSGTTLGGVPFRSLGTFAISTGTLEVVLGNDADGYVIADAVNIVSAPANPPPALLPAVVDHGQAEYAESGAWASPPSSYNATGYNSNNWRYAAGTGSTTAPPTATASWSVANLAPTMVVVQASWFADPNRASNAPYRIYDGNTLVATVRVNQRVAPSGTTLGGVTFQTLGTFMISSGTLRVVLGNDANGYVIADAIRVTAGG